MLCHIFRSPTKEFHYLYLFENTEFTDLPESLQQLFGQPEPVMQLDLDKTERLVNADIKQVRQDLLEKGFYLQMPADISVDELLAERFS